MARSRISAAMRKAVGCQLARRVSFPVTDSDIRRWAGAAYYPEEPPRQFWDEVYAKSTRYGGIVAPEDFNPFTWMAAGQSEPEVETDLTDPDRTELSVGVMGPGLKRQYTGGMEVEYCAPVRPGDVITSVTRLASYSERASRLGLILFTITEDGWTNQCGELVKRARTTLVRY